MFKDLQALGTDEVAGCNLHECSVAVISVKRGEPENQMLISQLSSWSSLTFMRAVANSCTYSTLNGMNDADNIAGH